jgi:hypothetical protein
VFTQVADGWQPAATVAQDRQSLGESDDTRDCICKIGVVDLLMIDGMRSKHVEELNNVICKNEQENLCIKLVIIKKLQ